MVILRSTCLVVLGLLFTSLALRNSAVHAQQANENGIAATGAGAVFASKELFEGVPAAASENKGLGGRKLVMGSILMKKLMEEEAVNGKTPKISGEDRNASKKPLGTSQKFMKDQKSMDLSKPKALNSKHSTRVGNPGSEPGGLPDTIASQLKSQGSQTVSNCGGLECSSRSRKLMSPEYHDHFHGSESKKLVEAANQIVNLIHKDYAGMHNPRCKPPINNHEPLSQSDDQKP